MDRYTRPILRMPIRVIHRSPTTKKEERLCFAVSPYSHHSAHSAQLGLTYSLSPDLPFHIHRKANNNVPRTGRPFGCRFAAVLIPHTVPRSRVLRSILSFGIKSENVFSCVWMGARERMWSLSGFCWPLNALPPFRAISRGVPLIGDSIVEHYELPFLEDV